ncbi:hypothetical protein Ae201684_003680 [Aphanomyces euteiches]|nr:hypothetical protein Ae201684_003680 [Aphanomyces euteiches]
MFKVKKIEMIAAANARAEESRRQAEEAKRAQEAAQRAAEEARRAADEALKEAQLRAVAEEERRKMEDEAKRAEEEAIALAHAAEAAVREAEMAAAEAAAAVEQERAAERKAMQEAHDLEMRMIREREDAQKRKEQALLDAAALSAGLLGGLATVNAMNTSQGRNVSVVEIPDNISEENKEQLKQLNELLLSGAIDQSEYEELIPFLLEAQQHSPAAGPVLTPEEQESLNRLYNTQIYGIQIRCPACGVSNNTANGNNCTECGSMLTAGSDRSSGMDHRYYGARARSMSTLALSTPPGTFTMDGTRVSIHGGFFQCGMHGTQMLQDENYAEYTVYVLRCGWQAKEASAPTYWLISHRFSVFEKLHKDLKHKIPPNMATLPAFPRKHRLAGVFAGRTGNSNEIVEERKAGLEKYMNEVIDICARLPDTLAVPELDRFLNLSRQVQQIQRQLGMLAGIEGGTSATNLHVEGAEALAAREQARLPTELPTPLDEEELAQTEQAVHVLMNSIRNAQGDLRRNQEVQMLLKVCVQLQPRLQMSANLDNPFANVELIPRAMQCQEDLEMTIGLYNDSLLAVTETYTISGAAQPPAPFVPGQTNSYQRTYGY